MSRASRISFRETVLRGMDGVSAKCSLSSDTEVGLVAEDVVEPVSEVGRTNHQREFDDLAFVVILPQLFERAGAHGCSAARDALGEQDGGFLFFIK
jgi:hypothetical protein